MRDIDYKLVEKDENNVSYKVFLRNKELGLITISKHDKIAIVKYNFNEKVFSSLIGVLLINEILISALDDFSDCNESKIYFSNDQSIDYYDDVFAIKKKEENNKVCYYLKR